MLVLAPLVLIVIILLIREKKRFIYYVPLVLLLADILKIANEGGQAARESILMDYIIIITTLAVCLMIILTNIRMIRGYASGIFILVFYFFGMIMFSTDVWWSFKVYMNVAMPLMLFPAAFIITNNVDDIKKALRPVILSIVLFLINVAVATYFKFGQEDIQQYGYVQTFLYMGTVNFFSAYGFVYALIIIPLAYYLTKGLPAKYLLIFLYFAGLFTLILLLKRSYVYLSLAGPLIFILLISKKKNIRFIGPFLIFGLLSYILLSDYILASITVRQEVIRRGYTEEGRGIELILYPEVVKNSNEPVSFLVFGEELFNSRGKFTLIEKILKDKDRVLHSDIATILFGSGIIGLFLFVRIYYYLLRKFFKIRHKLRQIYHNDMLNVLYAIYLSLLISLIANALSDGILTAINRALPYLMLGAIFGVLHKTLYGLPANHLKNPIP